MRVNEQTFKKMIEQNIQYMNDHFPDNSLEKQHIIDIMKESIKYHYHEGNLPPIGIENFNTIKDLRPFLLRHPDRQMVKESCLHYLGDKFQEFNQTQENT